MVATSMCVENCHGCAIQLARSLSLGAGVALCLGDQGGMYEYLDMNVKLMQPAVLT